MASPGTARAQEGADPPADRRDRPATVRRARLRARDRRRDRARRGRLPADGLQLLPDQGGPLLLAAESFEEELLAAIRGRAAGESASPPSGASSRPARAAGSATPTRAEQLTALTRDDPREPGAARPRAAGLRRLHGVAGRADRRGARGRARRRRAVGRGQRHDRRPSRARGSRPAAHPRRPPHPRWPARSGRGARGPWRCSSAASGATRSGTDAQGLRQGRRSGTDAQA